MIPGNIRVGNQPVVDSVLVGIVPQAHGLEKMKMNTVLCSTLLLVFLWQSRCHICYVSVAQELNTRF